jgi:glucose/arabinose dehydrogenase
VPGLQVAGYAPTPAVVTPGPITRESVIIEWTDTNIHDAVFEGTAREILRIQLNTQIHPTGDMIFNPTARRGDADWRVMYIGAGDGGSGEQKSPAMRSNPQRLDTLVGKILRIIPDPAEHTATSIVSANGRYRIPNDNPFVKTAGARGEIWAYGFRNPHRLTWEVDPARPANNRLLAMSIGLHTWETVNIVHKGRNYGYSAREGTEALLDTNQTGPRPVPDRLPVLISDTVTHGTTAVTYPVLEYNHLNGFAIMGGFVYHGTRLPALRGKFLFGDILTGRLWYADYQEMLAADDGKPDTLAARLEVQVRWNDPNDAPDAGLTTYPTMNPIVVAAYKARRAREAPAATEPMPARADIRFGLDAQGEIFILSKVDGMIRSVVGATAGN